MFIEMQDVPVPLLSRWQGKVPKTKFALVAAGAVVMALGGAMLEKGLVGVFAQPVARAAQIEQTLRMVATRVKATLPDKLNTVTTMTDIAYRHKNMIYVYDLDTRGEAPQEVMATLRELVGERACFGEFRDAMQYGYVFTFRYNSPMGAELGQFTLRAGDCA